jgi:fructan beta-fructosidase
MKPENNRLKLHLFIDWSWVEVFGNGGTVTITDRIFPSSESNDVEFFSEGGDAQIVSLDRWKLKPVWEK